MAPWNWEWRTKAPSEEEAWLIILFKTSINPSSGKKGVPDPAWPRLRTDSEPWGQHVQSIGRENHSLFEIINQGACFEVFNSSRCNESRPVLNTWSKFYCDISRVYWFPFLGHSKENPSVDKEENSLLLTTFLLLSTKELCFKRLFHEKGLAQISIPYLISKLSHMYAINIKLVCFV